MKIHKSTYQQMDDLFKEARQERPVMDLKEVQNIVNTGHYIPSYTVGGLHIGMNSVIVISGIVISSMLTFFTLKEDHRKADVPKPAISTNSVQQAPAVQTPPLQNAVVMPVTTESASSTKVHSEHALTKADKVRPAANTDKLLASTNDKVATDNTALPANASLTENEASAPAENNKMPITKKMSFVGFTVEIENENGDTIDMTLNDNDVTMLSINHKIVPEEKYSDYDDVISEAKIYASGHRAGNNDNYSLDLISYFDSQLRSDKILGSDSHYVFELTSSQLLINKTVQSYSVFRKYKKLYESKTGKIVTEGSVYRFEKGVKPE